MKKNVLKIVISGLLIALSIVLTRLLSVEIPIAGGIPGSRLGIGFLPIMLGSVILGPFYGMSVGALADVVGFFISPKGAYFPPITLTSTLVGLLPFIIVRFLPKIPNWLKVFLAVALTQILCSLLLQPLWLNMLLGGGYLALLIGRMPVVLTTIPIYSLLLNYVLIALKKARLIGLNNIYRN